MSGTPTIQIGTRCIGAGHPCYIIAEMSGNHGHNFEQALAIVRAAKAAGADAIKLQTYTADTLTIDCDANCFRIGKGSIWEGKNLYKLYGEAYTPWDWQPKLKAEAEMLGMDCFSTPFDASSVAFLETMNVPCHKIASFELVDFPLIHQVAATGKPIIMSTGMATLAEIEEALAVARAAGARDIALLKCTSAYPSPPEAMNLRTIADLSLRFGVVAGLSDHTMGVAVPAAAVALGACIVEKHFTLSRNVPGPDTAFSMEPEEFRQMVDAIRVVESAIGTVHYGMTEREESSRCFRRSLFVVEEMKAGEPFTAQNVRSIRPGYGLHTRHLNEVLGQRAACHIKRGTPMRLDLLAK